MSDYSDKAQAYFQTPRAEMLAFLPESLNNVLEIGCGNGAFGSQVKHTRNCRYVGVELFEDAAAQARPRLDQVHVLNVERDSLPFQEAEFDCLVCNDVLEHLVDPWATLRQLIRFLKPEGWIVASIPNVRFSEVVKDLVFRKKWEYAGQGVLDRTHLRFFTEISVRQLMESAGAQVHEIRGINPIKYAWRLQLLNLALFGALNEMRFMQIGCRAQIKKRAG